jgi:putative hydrolase of the HAD superfamily
MVAMFDVIAFDGDDTLWHNEAVFAMTHDRFRALVGPHAGDGAGGLDDRLFATEMANLKLFGYGVKAFMLSMIETAIDVSSGRVPVEVIQQIIDAGKDMLDHPVELLDGVRETVETLAAEPRRYRLMLITKGDLFHQESKLAASGLAELFWRVAVVAEKTPDVYRRVLRDHRVDPSRFLMVGDSVRSDILPVAEIGGSAVHVPFSLTWAHEAAPPVTDHPRVWNLDRIDELPSLLGKLDGAA